MRMLQRLSQTALFSLLLLGALTCKKNPITPNAEELTRPVIWLNTFELSFTAYESGGNPGGQVLKIKNSGQNTLQYTVSDDADWLSVEPSSGTSSGQPSEHNILVNKAGLAVQDADYEATISIVSPEAYNNPQRVSVKLNISAQPPPEIWVSPSVMTFSVKVGQNPPSQILKVKNSGEGTLTYDIIWDAPWINVAPIGGSSGGGEKSHTVSVDSKSLPQGSYDGSITISADEASNSPQSVRVSLQVSTTGPPPPPSTKNKISISCNPGSGGTGTVVSIPISIDGNLQLIQAFGLNLNFDANLFQLQSVGNGSLTGSWSVGYGGSGGVITIGGYAGGGTAIPVGSVGSIAVVTLRVTGAGYGDGHQSQITINGYADDITGLTPQPATTTFTFRQ